MNSLQKLTAVWPKKEDFSSLNLVIELSGRSISCYWHGKNARTAEGLVMYASAQDLIKENLVAESDEFFKNPVFKKKHKSVKVFIRPGETLLIPMDYYSSSAAAASLDLVFGDVSGLVIKTEDLQKSDIRICYRIPDSWQNFLSALFSGTGFRHSASSLLDRKKEVRGNLFECIFSPADFFISAYFSGKIHLMQQFEYRSPADAAYFLLALCHHNRVRPESVTLRLAGTIDKDSNLLNELYKYFLNIEWAGESAGNQEVDVVGDIPVHYFDHLVSLAACES